MPDFILPDTDPFADDDQEEQEAVEDPTGDEKPAGDWRSAPDLNSFLERYADSEAGAVSDYDSPRQQQRAVQERDARIQEAQEKQHEFMTQGEGLSELKGAGSLADFMMIYQKAGGIASDGWTIAEDASTGQLTIVEVD